MFLFNFVGAVMFANGLLVFPVASVEPRPEDPSCEPSRSKLEWPINDKNDYCGNSKYRHALGHHCTPPGLPGVPGLAVDSDASGVRITVVWKDPGAGNPLGTSVKPIGYEIRMFIAPSEDPRHIEKTPAQEVFSVPKEVTSSGPAENTVHLVSHRAMSACKSETFCITLKFITIQQLFGRRPFFSVQVVSLPKPAEDSKDEVDNYSSISEPKEMETCEAVTKGFSHKFPDVVKNEGCVSAHVGDENATVAVCESGSFKFTHVTYDNSSITIWWTWGEYRTDGSVILVFYVNRDDGKEVTVRQDSGNYTFIVDMSALAPRTKFTFFGKDIAEVKPNVAFSWSMPAEPRSPTQPAPATSRPLATTTSPLLTTNHHQTESTTHQSSSAVSTSLFIAITVCLVVVLVFVAVLVYRSGGCTRLSDLKSRRRPSEEPLRSTPQHYILEATCTSVYISYSRFTLSSKHQALRLAEVLRRHGLNPVIDLEHQHKLSDNVPQWVQQQVLSADFAVVLLDETYPWVLGSATMTELLNSDSGDDIKLAKMESDMLQSEIYCGRARFIVPVFIGTQAHLESCLPGILRCKKVYRLPKDFEYGNGGPTDLLARLSESPGQGAHTVVRLSSV